MTILDKITDAIRKILGLKKKVLVERTLKEDELEQLDKEIEYERGYKEGKISALEDENKDLKISLTPKDVDYAEYLQKQKTQLRNQQFAGSLSLKMMFSRSLISKKKIIATSYNSKKEFGVFDDILIRPDGRLAVVVQNGKSKLPIMVGPTIRDLFRNYNGLNNYIKRGIVMLNQDENGGFVRDENDAEVPELVIDANGKIHISKVNKKKYIEQLIEKDAEINELYGMISAYEQELNKLTSNKNVIKLIAKFNENRASTSEAELSKALQGATEIHKNFNELSRELTVKGNAQFINETKTEQLDVIREQLIGKMNTILSKYDVELARENYIMMANDIMDITQGSKINIITQQPKPAEPDVRLTEKFKKV